MMLGKLYYVIADPEVKKEIINEEYWLREDVANYEQKLELEHKIIEIGQKDAELEQKDAELGRKDAVIEQKDVELDEMKKRLFEYAKDLKSFGMSKEEISRKTGLSVAEIDKM